MVDFVHQGERQRKWDLRFLEMAKLISSWSKDPSTKVGAVIVDPRNHIISMGYNGFAQGVRDTDDRLNNREVKYQMILHAEENALSFAKGSLKNSTIYLYPFLSCAHCSSLLIQNRIKRVVAPMADNPRWNESWKLSKQIFSEAEVKVDLLDFK